MNLREQFGNIDIYLFDQLLKGRITPAMSVLDAGCGDGRNLIYLLRHNYEIFAVDLNPQAIQYIQLLAGNLAPQLSPENFMVANVGDLPFSSNKFDLVISSAVLHFADDEEHFDQMLNEMWRVLKPEGILFARLASSIGIEGLVRPTGGRRFYLPDGSERFLVDEALLKASTTRLGARQIEPLKTTNVENLRCMTTWVLCKES